MIGILLAGLVAASAATGPTCPTDPKAPAVAPVIGVEAKGGLAFGKVNYKDRVGLGDHELALTFDDGPDDDHTLAVLDILDRHCIKATFFLVGQEVDNAPQIVREIARRGHTLGSHTYSHPESLPALPLAEAEAEIDKGFAANARALKDAPPEDQAHLARFFRFPELVDSAPLLEALKARDITVMGADYGFDDWTDLPSDELYRRAIAYTQERRRGVIVMHDFNPQMIAMLDHMITTLEERGYHFVQIVQSTARN